MAKPPLPDLIRPKSLKEFIGQSHLTGSNKPIKLAIKKDQIHSMIFWGPPGSGKTTLSKIIASETKSQFFHLSAVSSGKADVKAIIKKAQAPLLKQKTILFLDEIHRFNKAQQDFLLPYVENGTIILIGATTENPSFSVISPLLSRCQVFILEPYNNKELIKIIEKGQSFLKINSISLSAKNFLIKFSDGDARQALNLLEITANLYKTITLKNLKLALQSKFLRYDKTGDQHYNTISAFIKSMRASNPDAALYYMSRMLESGEDPLFIARRMVIFSSEDIGMAQPTALVVANEVFKACQVIGLPECAINLAHGVVYLSKAKKDRSSYNALRAAQADIKKHGNLPIPLHLRNAPTKLMKNLNYGKGYEIYPDKNKNLLPEKLKNKKYYQEKKINH
ncbi:MAG: replication-associated recombination protein A [Patescibacteria group bacterium]|nr:replication-associated recombination protein A [Patescibacteria group bacterium]